MITTAIVYDHRGRASARDEAPIEVRVTVNRKVNYINTGIRVRGNEWKDGTISNRPDAEELNERLAIIRKRIEKAVNSLLEADKPITVGNVREIILRGQENEKEGAFLDWLAEQIPLLNVSEGRRYHYSIMLHRLVDWGKMKNWSDITAENICMWDAWLRKLTRPMSKVDRQQGNAPDHLQEASVWNYHKNLKAMLFRAVKFDKIPSNPYTKLRGEFKRGTKENVEYLTDEEMAAIESIRPVEGSQMAAARDLFVFQMYTGLAYRDAREFDIAKYHKVDGRWVAVGERVKTGVPFVIQLLQPAVEVLERYGWHTPDISNQDYNDCLKVLGLAAGIKTRLHSHLARHTFATFMLRNGVKIENLSRMLGHTNITQTQRYAKVLAQSVQNDLDRIAEMLSKKRESELK